MLKLNTKENVLIANGEIDIATARQFEESLLELISYFPIIAIDLSDVNYLDSVAVEILMNLKKNILRPDQDIILRNPTNIARKIFDLTGISKIYDIEEFRNE